MKRSTERWLVVALVLVTGVYAIAEDITLTTYYPSPRGVYEQVRATQNVSVGPAVTPDAPLLATGSVLLGNNGALMFEDTAGVDRQILRLDSNNDVTLWNPRTVPPDPPNGDILFGTQAINGTGIRMTIKNTGNIGIGTTTPGVQLAVASPGAGSVTSAAISATGTNSNEQAIFSLLTSDANNNGQFDAGDRGWSFMARGNSYFTAAEQNDLILFSLNAGTATRVLHLDQGGNVGIGTTGPAVRLDVRGGGIEQVQIGNPAVGSRYLYEGIHQPGGYARLGTWNPGTSSGFDLVLQDSGGNVGIGTTTPGAKMHVVQSGASASFRVDDQTADPSPFLIDTNGNVGIGTPIPTQKLDVNGTVKVGTFVGDPGGGTNGSIYYNTATNRFRGFQNGAWVDFGAGTQTVWGLVDGGRVAGTGFTVTKNAGSNYVINLSPCFANNPMDPFHRSYSVVVTPSSTLVSVVLAEVGHLSPCSFEVDQYRYDAGTGFWSLTTDNAFNFTAIGPPP